MAASSTSLTGSDQAVKTTMCTFFGMSVANTHATEDLVVTAYNDPNSADGRVLGTVAVLAGESGAIWLGPQGVLADLGIYVDVSATGTAVGCVYHG